MDNKTDEITLRGTFIAEANSFNTRTTCEPSWFTWTHDHSEALGGFVDVQVEVGFAQLIAF